MNHSESAIQVFFTKEYSRFSMITGNRQLNEGKIKKIMADIENGCDLLRYCPVLVYEQNNKLSIIDGQHRFKVAQMLRSPIWYIIASELSLYEIAKMNSNTEKWKDRDYINCYVELGNENYKILRRFLNTYPVPVTVATALLESGKIKSGGSIKQNFEQGKFQVKHEENAIEFLELINTILFKEKYNRNFLQAIETIQSAGKIKICDFIERINNFCEDVKYQPDVKSYLLHLEQVYNKGKQSRITIY